MNIKTKFPRLYYFLAAYFHVDCRAGGETFDDIVNEFMVQHDNNTKVTLFTEIVEFLTLYRNELKKTYVDNFTYENIMIKAGVSSMPMSDDMSAYDWLVMIKERLIKEIGSKNLNSK
ncbi:contact-dependent growth inhibition system immunity protein [Bartonella sp. HY329]|uniref:contact-dependent growth inhibition system immunity protein n=1 Tax=unclassified Bartonella TaxID=2645622 RepID=UPI0021C7318B|nr:MULTISPECIES: contact-dependent growth inhibition system immunity protein [unclassified Bartonella]UXM96206.1 contact-dependent growth inhibition system immunity protein [Bartonella sp. HY329]UXN10530.1 contact-dependent growth inhibition system immunity protein [Bartonella sp. HY328]